MSDRPAPPADPPSAGRRRSRGDRLLRRIRPGRRLVLARLPSRPTVPNARGHAQLFVLAFAALIVTGGVLLALPVTTESGRATPPVDALFTAVSAACVTGLVTVDTADHWNRAGEVTILLLMQGGGLSFTVGASIILQMLRRGASLRDALLLRDGEPALSLAEVTSLAGRIVRYTLAVEAVGALALFLRFVTEMPPARAAWHSVFLAVSAFCNASFDLSGGFRSLTPYQTDVWVNLVIAGLIQAGALSYLVLSDLWRRRRWSRLTLDARLVVLAHGTLVVAGALAFLALEWGRSLAALPVWARPMAATFESVAARSGGFATVNFGEAGDGILFVFVGIMAVGGASGGTAGGVRLATVAVVVAAVAATLRGQVETQVLGRRITSALVLRALAVIALFGVAHFLATLALAVTEGPVGGHQYSLIALMFEAMSALATDGLSTGITPTLTVPGKLVLCGAMFLGRVGPLTAVYALQRRQQATVRYRFPEAAVRIG